MGLYPFLVPLVEDELESLLPPLLPDDEPLFDEPLLDEPLADDLVLGFGLAGCWKAPTIDPFPVTLTGFLVEGVVVIL